MSKFEYNQEVRFWVWGFVMSHLAFPQRGSEIQAAQIERAVLFINQHALQAHAQFLEIGAYLLDHFGEETFSNHGPPCSEFTTLIDHPSLLLDRDSLVRAAQLAAQKRALLAVQPETEAVFAKLPASHQRLLLHVVDVKTKLDLMAQFQATPMSYRQFRNRVAALVPHSVEEGVLLTAT